MAENKKTFIFYSDWINMVREMPNSDAGELLKHILSYVNDESPTTDNIFVKMAFGHMEPMLKADLIKWENQLQKYRDMGKLSAEKRKKQHKSTYVEPTLTQVEPMNTVNDNDNVNVNVNEKKKINIEFINFWDLYPKKVAKDKCELKWNSLTDNERNEIIKTLPDYIKHKPFPDYIHPNPFTYLNQKRWQDVIEIKTLNLLQ